MTGSGVTREPYCFADELPGNEDEQWVLAYTWCRDWDRPIVVRVGCEVAQIFPSGHSRPVRMEVQR